MAKKKNTSTVFTCSSCGFSQPKWLGRCPDCGEWNTFTEQQILDGNVSPFFSSEQTISSPAKPVPLSVVPAMDQARVSTGIDEFDRVLGGGAMKRSAVLIGGEPGIGKSTLLLQAASSIASSGLTKGKILYISGEESASQIKARADRLALQTANIEILCTAMMCDAEQVLNDINPVLTIVDSIQTMYSSEAGAVPGTVNQLKYAATKLVSWVKQRDSILIMTAHVTKEGTIAGPKALEHIVDTVISFERNDDDVRFLRAQKNRFGSVDELGIFSMTAQGLKTIEDPSSMFITQRTEKTPAGTAFVPVIEGTRIFLVEIQALTVPAKAGITRVYSEKIDAARVSRIAAVLEKRTGLRFSDQDIYVNVAGGIRITESAADTALAAALFSARTDFALPEHTALIGEMSLAGEIRPVTKMKQRIKAAQNLGFTSVYAPDKENGAHFIESVSTLTRKLFGKQSKQGHKAES